MNKGVGQYVIHLDKPLGKGSFGSVYRGYCHVSRRPLAFKILEKSGFRNLFNLKAMTQEIQIMKTLKHININSLVDVVHTKSHVYIVSDLCDNDLSQLIRKQPFAQVDALNIFKQLLSGIKYLHQNSLVHRDLKPANVLLKDGTCRLTDFGFARKMQEKDLSKSLVGTPFYMSPQLLRKQHYSSKTQIWSLGLILYEMITGRLPWRAKNEMELLGMIASVKPEFPPKLFSEQTKILIEGCLGQKEQNRISWDQLFVRGGLVDSPPPLQQQNRFNCNLLSFISKKDEEPKPQRGKSKGIEVTHKNFERKAFTSCSKTQDPRPVLFLR